jgi:hypothetical protein
MQLLCTQSASLAREVYCGCEKENNDVWGLCLLPVEYLGGSGVCAPPRGHRESTEGYICAPLEALGAPLGVIAK